VRAEVGGKAVGDKGLDIVEHIHRVGAVGGREGVTVGSHRILQPDAEGVDVVGQAGGGGRAGPVGGVPQQTVLDGGVSVGVARVQELSGSQRIPDVERGTMRTEGDAGNEVNGVGGQQGCTQRTDSYAIKSKRCCPGASRPVEIVGGGRGC
jgi:hypothetical protein